MADIVIRLPLRPVDGSEPPLVTLKDQGDGTHAPQVQAANIVANVATDGSVGDLVTALIAAGLMASS